MAGKYPNQDDIIYGIVVGGDSEDPAPDKAGGFRVRVPGQYGPNVLDEHLPFVRMLAQGTQAGIDTFNPPPERGSAVMAMKVGGHSGTGHMVILGTLPNDIMKSVGIAGGKSLNQFFDDAINHKTNKKAPPKKLKNDQRDGAQIRKVEDKEMWSHALVKHIPSTATAWPMSGIPLPKVGNINTAIQHFSGILDGAMLGGLPGSLMSLGSMFDKLKSGGLFDQVMSKLPEELKGAMESMSNLIPSIEIAESAGFSIGGRVHEETFLANAVDLLSQARSIGDITDVLHRLQFDVDLFGQDELEEISINVDTPFGDLEILISFDGDARANINIASIIASANANTANANTATSNTRSSDGSSGGDGNNIAQNIFKFVNIMTSAQQAFAMSGENMFGKSAKQKFDMYNRMNPGALNTAKKLIETLNTGEKETNYHRKLAKIVRDGGKMLSGEGFKGLKK